MRKRGATLVEIVLTMTLTAMLLGTITLLYGFTMARLAHATANYATVNDSSTVADKIKRTVQESAGCTSELNDGDEGLKCVMPLLGTDRDNDGKLDKYQLKSVTRRGMERLGRGKRVWYYLSDSTGNFGATGTQLYRAERSDDLNPTAADVDWSFFEVNETKQRYGTISDFDFTVSASAQLVTFSLGSTALNRSDRLVSTLSSTSEGYSLSTINKAYWRHALK